MSILKRIFSGGAPGQDVEQPAITPAVAPPPPAPSAASLARRRTSLSRDPSPSVEMPSGLNNYIIVILDSCRFDSFVAAAPRTLARLGETEKRWSYASWTAPSHYNLLMGLLPHHSPSQVYASEYYKRDFIRYNERLGTDQIEFKSLEHNRNTELDAPYLLVHIWPENLLRLTKNRCAYIHGRRMHYAFLIGGKHDWNLRIARFSEIGILRHVLLFVGGNGPNAEVVDLLIHVVADSTTVVPPLRLENTDGLALPLCRSAAAVDCLDVFVIENDSGSIFGVVGCVDLIRLHCPVWERLVFIEDPARTVGGHDGEKSGHN